MELELDRPGNYPHVRHVDVDAITVADHQLHRLTASFILTGEQIIEHWPVTDAAGMQPADVEALLSAEPEVILLGTGAKLTFPPTAVMAAVLKRGIGIEPMDNAAAARTHTVLASEGRRVVAAFILPTLL